MTLPSLRPREVVRALKRAGFEERRQRGSHLILAKLGSDDDRIVIVPMHSTDVPRGTLRAIIRDAGLDEAGFRELL